MLLLLIRKQQAAPTAVSVLWRVDVDGEAMLATVPAERWQTSAQAPALVTSVEASDIGIEAPAAGLRIDPRPN